MAVSVAAHSGARDWLVSGIIDAPAWCVVVGNIPSILRLHDTNLWFKTYLYVCGLDEGAGCRRVVVNCY